MIAEMSVMAVLAFAGFLTTGAFRDPARQTGRVFLAIPVGAFIYMVMALLSLLTVGRVDPRVALGATALIGLGLAVVISSRREWRRDDAGMGLALIALTLGGVAVNHIFPMARLTEDSMQNLYLSLQFQLPGALELISPPPLVSRQLGLASLHALSSLTGLRYVPSLGTLFGLSTIGLFCWITYKAGPSTRWRVWLVGATAAFLLSGNRFLYSWFYINSHVQVAAYLLISLVAAWLAMTRSWTWAPLSGMGLAALLLFRPDSPLIVGMVMVVIASLLPENRTALWIATPPLVVGFSWLGLILFRYSEFAGVISLASPVFSGILVVLSGTVALISVRWGFFRQVARYYGLILVAGMAVALVGATLMFPTTALASARATVLNTIGGYWFTTWWVAVALGLVAFFVHRIPYGRLWTQAITAMALLYWLLPLLRDGAYRLGPGDSGVRILIHFLPVVTTFLVLAVTDFPRVEEASYEGLQFSSRVRARTRKVAISARVSEESGQN
ncbi:MAG TPA: hypothetical protein VF246_05820 [Acidimicrobiia bacterium]